MKTFCLLVSALLSAVVGFSTAAQAASDASGSGSMPANNTMARAELAEQIVLKWGPHVQEAYRADVKAWAKQLVPMFKLAPMRDLQQAVTARSFDAMNDALLGNKTMLSAGKGDPTTQALGDVAADLVFVPVSPCRILDTRVAGGSIANNTARDFDVTAIANYSGQGGEPSDCNGVGAAGSFAAAVINFTVVSTSTTGGFITAYPLATTRPNASNLNWEPGTNIVRGNLATVRLDQGASANELSVYVAADGGAHLIGDIVGYFITPQATALQCIEKTGNVNDIGAGSFGSVSTANCDAGYTITGGGCSMSTFDGRVVTTRTIVDGSGQRHFCAFRSEAGSGTVDGVAYARCCRTPGRF